MIKLIILSLIGRDKIKNPNALFRLVKSYLIVYMLALPAGKIMAEISNENRVDISVDKTNSYDNFGEENNLLMGMTVLTIPTKNHFIPIESE
jgi:hypothetical protein